MLLKIAAVVGAIAVGGPLAVHLVHETPARRSAIPPVTAQATFAGGCFWSIEKLFDNMDGVVSATSGFTGGTVKDPSYEQVSSGATGHREAVLVVYDPAKVTYEQLLDAFWHDIDPTTPDGQFCDFGPQYRTAVFYHDETQHRLAQASKEKIDQSKKLSRPVVTEILPAQMFYPAEDYHQDFARRHADRYSAYRIGCGRDRKLHEVWGSDAYQSK
jgi:peptide-methionine (S)-S-oxide reductase